MSSVPPPPPTVALVPAPIGLPALPSSTTAPSESERSRRDAVNSIVAAGVFSRPELDAQIRTLLGRSGVVAQRPPTDYEELAERLISTIGLLKELDNHRRFLAERVAVLEDRMMAVEQRRPAGEHPALHSAELPEDCSALIDGAVGAPPPNWPVICGKS